MKFKLTIITLFLLTFSFSSYAQKDVSEKSAEAIKEMKRTNDKIGKYFSSAYGYAVFPSVLILMHKRTFQRSLLKL